MITHYMFAELQPKEHTSDFAYTVLSLTRVARLALENNTSGAFSEEEKSGAVATQLELIEALVAVIIDGAEVMEQTLGVGVYKRPPEAAPRAG